MDICGGISALKMVVQLNHNLNTWLEYMDKYFYITSQKIERPIILVNNTTQQNAKIT